MDGQKTVDQLTTETIDLLFHKFSLLRECLKTSILDSFVVDPKPKRKKGLRFETTIH